MCSHQELLDMIATEAVEDAPPREQDKTASIPYDLRLVRTADGKLEWRDD